MSTQATKPPGKVATRNQVLLAALLGLIGTISGLPSWVPAVTAAIGAAFGVK